MYPINFSFKLLIKSYRYNLAYESFILSQYDHWILAKYRLEEEIPWFYNFGRAQGFYGEIVFMIGCLHYSFLASAILQRSPFEDEISENLLSFW